MCYFFPLKFTAYLHDRFLKSVVVQVTNLEKWWITSSSISQTLMLFPFPHHQQMLKS